jgi:probable F420-dependent oxidoreductase
MKFGVQVQHFRQFASPEAIRACAQRAEELGFDSIWVTDHIFLPNMPETRRFGTVFYDAILTLTWAAAQTQRVRLGTSVLILPYRNPLVAAKQIATLDALSGGRVILGVGAGWCVPEFEMLGVPPHRRGAITDEYLRAYKELWTSQDPRFSGEFVSFGDIAFEPKPVQKPHPPIWVGGASRAAIRRAAEHGDYWHPTSAQTPEAIAQGRELLRRLAEERGRDPDAIGVAARAHLKFVDGAGQADQRSLIGTPEFMRQSLRRFQAAGVDYFMIDTFYGTAAIEDESLEAVLAKMERFAREIMPEFQG